MEYKTVKQGFDTYIYLGVMRKAIVIRRLLSGYAISEGSFFPFPKEMYDNRYETQEEAIKSSFDYFLLWFNQTNDYFLKKSLVTKNVEKKIDNNYLL